MGYRESVAGATYRMRGHPPESVRMLEEALATHGIDPVPDVYGTGAVLEDFQALIAAELGKERAVFFPSGTMAQQIALRIACDEQGVRRVAYHPTCHLEIHENQGLQVLHGIEAVLLGDADRLFGLSDLEASPEVACVLFELPQREIGGQLPSWDELVACVAHCRSRGFRTHLDGARLWECLPYYGKSAAEACALFDSVYVSFYKSLGGVCGAILAGRAAFLAEAVTWKRRYGGDLYHLYPYAITARYVHEMRKDRMGEYWAGAKDYARRLNALPGVRTVPAVPVCNLFHVHLDFPLARVEAALVRVIERHDLSLFGGLVAKGPDRTVTEYWRGDCGAAVPGALLAAALETFAEALA
jgi:threonine aldolase